MIRKMVLPGVTIVVVSPPADARPFLDDGGAPDPLEPRRDRTLAVMEVPDLEIFCPIPYPSRRTRADR